MRAKGRVAIAIIGVLVFGACANYNVHIDEALIDRPPAERPTLMHTIYFVGDAGEETDIQKRNFELLQTQAGKSEVPVSCVFLGDNIYPVGLPPKKDPDRERAEKALSSQWEVLEDEAENILFIGGNHDWRKGKPGGLKAIQRQAEFIEDEDEKHIRFIPDDGGCPGPEAIELTDNSVLILIDSQWWLQDWSTEKGINDDCEHRTRFGFLGELEGMIRDYQERQIIIAMHHPPISSGSHGGFFTWRDHFFPLTHIHPALYVPLPVIGSIYPVYRSTYGHVQDQAHPKYSELVDGLLYALQQYENVIVVSGHEHALEYHKYNGHHLLVSGSGSRVEPVANSPTTIYGHATPGFMQVDVYEHGRVELKVWEPDENGEAIAPAFESRLVAARKPIEDITSAVPLRPTTDSTTTEISTEFAKSPFYRFLFGERYRPLYELPVTVRNIALADEHGGLVAVQKGGGFQTNSLRLEAPDGHQYVLRSLNKDATRLLPQIYQSTFANDILQDQFTASHPFAAFVIPDMAEAAGIYHTNPELVYLTRQKPLGRYNGEFNGALYLYEERPDEDWGDEASFGNSEDIISYSDLVEEQAKSFRNFVDQPFVVRSRLFDMFIGDWDRHDDQWRWASFERTDGKGDYFRPIPRDRDQAFSDYDGMLVTMANWYTPSLRKMSRFTGDIKRIKWFNFNARHFDRDFTNEMTRHDWVSAGNEIKDALTDEVIDSALHGWRNEVFQVQGEEIAEVLRQRRDKLPEFANDYYEELARWVIIKGSENADYFIITRYDDSTRVEIYDSNKKDELREKFYSRTLYDNETYAVEIYGLDGADNFEFVKVGRSNIQCYVVGGEGKDEFLGGHEGPSGRIRAYDTHSKEKSIGVHYREVDDLFNTYDRLAFEYNYAIPLFILGWNPDDGLLLGGGMQWVRHGFKKEPFASRHTIKGSYSFGSGSFRVDYLGEWRQVLGPFGVELDALYQARSYVENFFGFGNDTPMEVDDIDYYRVRKRSLRVMPALTYGGDQGHNFKVKAGVQSHKVEATDGRFITDPENGLDDDVFDDRRFASARTEYRFISTDDNINTHRGFRFDLLAGVDHEWNLAETHTFVAASMSLYFEFKRLGQPVLATRIGGEVHNGDYQFYQAARLGAHDNFRGMPKYRLTADRMFYQNIDLRFNLAKWRNYYLPAQMGLLLNFDHGRVWLDGEASDTWHYAYGGGVWVSPFQALLLSLTYNVSDLDQRFNLEMGFFF